MRSDAAGSLLRPSFLAASPAEFKRFEDRAVRRAGDHGALESPQSLRPLSATARAPPPAQAVSPGGSNPV